MSARSEAVAKALIEGVLGGCAEAMNDLRTALAAETAARQEAEAKASERFDDAKAYSEAAKFQRERAEKAERELADAALKACDSADAYMARAHTAERSIVVAEAEITRLKENLKCLADWPIPSGRNAPTRTDLLSTIAKMRLHARAGCASRAS